MRRGAGGAAAHPIAAVAQRVGTYDLSKAKAALTSPKRLSFLARQAVEALEIAATPYGCEVLQATASAPYALKHKAATSAFASGESGAGSTDPPDSCSGNAGDVLRQHGRSQAVSSGSSEQTIGHHLGALYARETHRSHQLDRPCGPIASHGDAESTNG